MPRWILSGMTPPAVAHQDLLSRLGASSRDRPARLGRYDVVDRLGRGGMGTVYVAVDRERGTEVALKTILVADASAGVKLKREFRAVADLVHPHLASVYELASEDGLWFFTMELVKGHSLAQWARDETEGDTAETLPMSRTRASPLSDLTPVPGDEDRALPDPPRKRRPAVPPVRGVAEVCRAVAELARGIAALHDAGLRHGDIKPDNVLVREDGSVVVVDFGLSRPVSDMREKLGAGTPMYMPPEQLAGEYVGSESDWYAVGATLYRVLTGQRPFHGSSLLELFFKKSHDVPPPPIELVEGVSQELSDLCMALLSPDPAQRPGRQEVLRVCSGTSIAPPVGSERYRRTIFVGRERELAVLEKGYGSARAGRGTLVHLHGPSGIGKSALAQSFLRAVRGVDAAIVLRGRCYERETVPYKGFDRILDALAERLRSLDDGVVKAMLPTRVAELARVFPALASVRAIDVGARNDEPAEDPHELRRRAWSALGDLLVALRRSRVVVLAIDDLQWADPDTIRLLDSLLSRDDASLLVVVSFRPEEVVSSPELDAYFSRNRRRASEGMLVDLPLGPLSVGDAERLARATLQELKVSSPDRHLASLVRESHGVPFFIEELAHYLARAGAESFPAELSLDEAILARVHALDPEQRALAEVVAVANSPTPQSVAFEAAGVDAGSLGALLALRKGSLVRWSGVGTDDAVTPYHDRIREAVLNALTNDERLRRHLAIGRALSRRGDHGAASSWVFEAARHLSAAESLIEDRSERDAAARLQLRAGELARQGAAFSLAFQCFENGIAMLPEDAWASDYALTLRLHSGAAEAAYLSAEWEALDRRIAEIKKHGRTVMDQLVAWEAQIDAHVGRRQYEAAIAAGAEVLGLLGVQVPVEPTEEQMGVAVKTTLDRLTAIGPEGLTRMPDLTDPAVIAATRIQGRLCPAAYFGHPMLLPLLACNLVQTSIDRGLSHATPYALAVFGIVLNKIGLYRVSHPWGRLALELVERWPDRRLEAATRHIVNNLVCCWTVPLSTIVDPLREVFDIGCRTGDFEFASYAAHGYVHNAMYAGRSLGPLVSEALVLGQRMRALGQVNAMHVHAPFEQLLLGLTGQLDDPATLTGEGYDEDELLETLAADGSRAGLFVQHVAMGLARYWFGGMSEASDHLEMANTYSDAGPSVWHLPIMHQFGGLAACAAMEGAGGGRREELERRVEVALGALRVLAEVSETNFAHRLSLVEAARHRAAGERDAALAACERAMEQAQVGGWVNDVALANELAADCTADAVRATGYLRAARVGYAAWGAEAKAARVAARIATLDHRG